MKTTLDLPDALVNEVKERAQHDGRNLNDAVADLLRKGLAAADEPQTPATGPAVQTRPQSGLPYVECSPDAPARTMTISELIGLERETLGREDRERIGLPPRQ